MPVPEETPAISSRALIARPNSNRKLKIVQCYMGNFGWGLTRFRVYHRDHELTDPLTLQIDWIDLVGPIHCTQLVNKSPSSVKLCDYTDPWL